MEHLSRIFAKAGLTVDNGATFNGLVNANTDTDRFLVADNGVLKFRTGAEILSDIGGASSASGLPIGGTAGQILAKIDATNYNTEWIDNFTTDVRQYVKAGEAINKGQAVYISSADGTNPIVSKASNASEATSSKTLGLLAQNLSHNGFGYVITEGRLSGLDTSSAQIADPVWLGTNGNLIFGLANKPIAPAHLVYLGVVTRVNQNNGEIFVHVQNGVELNEIHDVLIQSVANKDIIYRDASTNLWKNASIATVLGFTPADNAALANYQLTSQKAQPNGYASLDGNGKVPLAQMNDSIIGQVEYMGLWNAATNTPTLSSTPQQKGHYYIVSAAGTQFGITFEIGDWIISDGTTWSKVDNTDAVSSVFGRVGNVAAAEADYQSFYPRLSQVYANPSWISELAWSKITGTPTTLAGYGITDAVPSSRTITINGTTYDLSANRTWTISEADTLATVTARGNTTSANVFLGQYLRTGSYPHFGETVGGLATLVGNNVLPGTGVNKIVRYAGGDNGTYIILRYNAGIIFGTALASTVGSEVDDTSAEAMRLTTTRNLLINTSTDIGKRLYVHGDAQIGSNPNAVQLTVDGAITTNGIFTSSALSFNGLYKIIYANDLTLTTNNNLGYIGRTIFTFTQQTPVADSGTGLMDLVNITAPVNTGSQAANSRALVIDFNVTSNAGTLTAIDAVSGIIRLRDLSGTGTRMVVADSSGVLSTQAIPVGTVTSVGLTTGISGTDVNVSGSPVTGSGVITLNIPNASTSARGLVTTGTQSFSGQKTFNSLSTIFDSNESSTNLEIRAGGVVYGRVWGGLFVQFDATSSATNGFLWKIGSGSNAMALSQAGILTVNNLSGTGTRMVVADSSGVLSTQAIPSLSGYVPYSGATTNVDLNNQTLSAGLVYVEGQGGNGGQIGFKQYVGSSLVGLSGYNTISSITKNTFVFSLHQSGTDYKRVQLQFTNVPLSSVAVPSLELPSQSGTLALISNITTSINGTTNWIPRFTSANTIGLSNLYDGSSFIGVFTATDNLSGAKLQVNGAATFTGKVSINTAGNGELSVFGLNSTSDKYITLKNSDGDLYLGTSSTSNYLWGVANIPLLFYTNNLERMQISASGNLGLGVTPSAWGASYRAIQLGNLNGLVLFGYNGGAEYGLNYYYDTDYRYATSNAASNYIQSGGQHIWRTAPSGTAGNAITFTQAMTLDASGRLLVGLNNVTGDRLQVSGNIYTNGTNTNIYLDNGGTGGASLKIGVTGTTETYINSLGDDPLILLTNNTERMRITSSGRTLIGTTTDNTVDLLQVAGSGRFSSTLKLGNGELESSSTLKLAANNTTIYLRPVGANNSTGQVAIDNTGAATFSSTITSGAISATGVSTFNRGTLQMTLNPSYAGGNVYSQIQSTGALALATGGDNNRLYIDTSGNLGLGVQPSAWLSTLNALQIGAAHFFGQTTGNGTVSLGNNAYLNSTPAYIYQYNGKATRYSQYDGGHEWYTAPSGTAGNAITFTQAMTLTASGNLAINDTTTTSASGYNWIRINGSTGGVLELTSASSRVVQLQSNGTSAGGILQTVTDSPLAFGTNGSEKMRITSSGNVGIGTASPETLLHINKNTAGGEGGYIYLDNGAASTISSSVGIRFGTSSGASFAGVYTGEIKNIITNAGDGASALTFGTFDGSSAAERLRITSSGNVGIGTSTFNYTLSTRGQLAINGTTDVVMDFQVGTISYGYIYAASSGFEMTNPTNNPLKFITNNVERMRITSSGRTLIGTSTDNTVDLLQVAGKVAFNGETVMDGNNWFLRSAALNTDLAINYNGKSGASLIFYSGTTTRFRVTSAGRVNMPSLPTSSAGLSAGDLWNDGGTVKIV